MVFYRLTYDNHTQFKILMRKLLLIGALIADFFAICTIIEIAVDGIIYLAQLLGLIILSTVLRIVSMRLLTTFEYKYCGNEFTVTATDSLTTKIIIKLIPGVEFTVEKNFKELQNKVKYVNLCGDCPESKYLLTINNKSYLLALDEYMFALINAINDGVTENNDIL